MLNSKGIFSRPHLFSHYITLLTNSSSFPNYYLSLVSMISHFPAFPPISGYSLIFSSKIFLFFKDPCSFWFNLYILPGCSQFLKSFNCHLYAENLSVPPAQIPRPNFRSLQLLTIYLHLHMAQVTHLKIPQINNFLDKKPIFSLFSSLQCIRDC